MLSMLYGELNTLSKTADYTTAGTGERLIFVNPTGGAFTITLGDEDYFSGSTFLIWNTTTSTNAITLKSESGNINGTAGGTGITLINASREAALVTCDGTNWFAVQMSIPS